jgi:hypothetical protein
MTTTTTQTPGRIDAPAPNPAHAPTPTASQAPGAGRLTRPRRRSLSARIRAYVSRALARLSEGLTVAERADAARDAAAVLAALAPALAATRAASPDDVEACEVCAAPAETVVSVDGVPVVVCRVCAVLPAGVLAARTRPAVPATRRARRDLRAVA